MRIALLGTRGPGFYGGFETCVAELAPRLAARGHEVTVYARSWSESRHWRHEGVRVVSIPSVRTKNLDTITHSALCAVHAMTANRPDVAAVFGVGNAMFARSLRAARVPTVLNVDGLDRQRAKWGRFARWWLSRSERWAIPAATVLVTDAHSIKKYYSDCYGADSTFIPYGAPDGPVTGTDEITGRGLVPGGYVLYVSRLEPENNAHIALEAYASSGITLPFVVVGGAAYGSNYESSLHELATDGVVFCGFVFGEGYRQLQSHASVYLQCTEVGGTHPALIEAMAYGNAVVALDTREHREVLGGAGRYYSAVDELAAILRELADDIAGRERWGNLAASRAAEMFSWEAVTDAYEAAFHAAASRE